MRSDLCWGRADPAGSLVSLWPMVRPMIRYITPDKACGFPEDDRHWTATSLSISSLYAQTLLLSAILYLGSSINDVMQEGGRGGSGPHDQQCWRMHKKA